MISNHGKIFNAKMKHLNRLMQNVSGIYSFYQNYIILKICAGPFSIVIPILAVFTLNVVASVFRGCLLQFDGNEL